MRGGQGVTLSVAGRRLTACKCMPGNVTGPGLYIHGAAGRRPYRSGMVLPGFVGRTETHTLGTWKATFAGNRLMQTLTGARVPAKGECGGEDESRLFGTRP